MKNKIILGDCLEIMEQFSNKSIDMFITDPPYGDNYKSNRQQLDRKLCLSKGIEIKNKESYFNKIKNDNVILTEWMTEAYRTLKNNSALYCFCKWKQYPKFMQGLVDAGFTIKNMIVLNKSNHGMGDLKGQYAPKHELLIFAVKGRHILNYESRPKDVIDVPVKFSGARRLHPNEKPLSWHTPFIEYSSRLGDTICDPFCGSASSGEASIKLNRNYIGIELDKEYVKVARKRINDI